MSLSDCAQCPCIYIAMLTAVVNRDSVFRRIKFRDSEFGLGKRVWFGCMCRRHDSDSLGNLLCKQVARIKLPLLLTSVSGLALHLHPHT